MTFGDPARWARRPALSAAGNHLFILVHDKEWRGRAQDGHFFVTHGEGRPGGARAHASERRRVNRAALRLAATMRKEGGAEVAAQLIDISTHGCRIKCSSTAAADSWLWLDVAGLETQHCRVVWRCEEFAGLEFEPPVADAGLERLLRDQARLPKAGINELRDIAARTHGLARQANDAEIHPLAELSRTCAVDAVVEGLRLSEAGRAGTDGVPQAPPAAN